MIDLTTLQQVGTAVLADLLTHMGLGLETPADATEPYGVSATVHTFPGEPDIEDIYSLVFNGFEGQPVEVVDELTQLAMRLVVERGITEPVTIGLTDDSDRWRVANEVADEAPAAEAGDLENWTPPEF